MKKLTSFFLTFLLIIIVGCHKTDQKTFTSSNLIYDHKKISILQMQSQDKKTLLIKDKKVINNVVNLLRNKKVKKLTKVEYDKVTNNEKAFITPGNYVLTLSSAPGQSSPESAIKCVVLLLTNGKIIYYDVKTIASSQAPVTYITKNQDPKALKDIINMINNQNGK